MNLLSNSDLGFEIRLKMWDCIKRPAETKFVFLVYIRIYDLHYIFLLLFVENNIPIYIYIYIYIYYIYIYIYIYKLL